MTEVKEKPWQVVLPRSAKADVERLARLYGSEFPVSLGNAVAKAVREELKRLGGGK